MTNLHELLDMAQDDGPWGEEPELEHLHPDEVTAPPGEEAMYAHAAQYLNFAPAGARNLEQRQAMMVGAIRSLATNPSGLAALIDLFEGDLRACWRCWLDPNRSDKELEDIRRFAQILSTIVLTLHAAISAEQPESVLDRAFQAGKFDAVLAEQPFYGAPQ